MRNQIATHKVELTSNQMALWLGQQLHPELPLYNTAAIYEIYGPVDTGIFQRAFQELLHHTDALRFQFHEENGMPYQSVVPFMDFELPLLDAEKDLAGEDISSYTRARTQRPLDISKRVFDSCLIRVKDDHFVWFINIHHLVTDGSSRLILFQRLQQIYKQLSSGMPVELPESASLLDYVSSNTFDLEKASEPDPYWDSKRRETSTPPMLYGKRVDADTSSYTRIPVALGKKRTAALKQLAQLSQYKSWTADSSLMNVLSALLFAFIYRISGEEQIAIGMPIHNRFEKRFRNTVGYFVDLFPLRLSLEHDQGFDDLITSVRNEVLETLKVAVNGAAPPDLGKYYHVVLNYIPTRFEDFNGMDIRTEWIPSGHMERNHALRCHISDYEGGGDLEVLLDINDSLLDEQLQERISAHFLALTDALIEDTETRIGIPQLSIPEAYAELELIEDWQPIKQIIPKCLAESFAAHEKETAIRHGNSALEFGALDQLVDRLASIMVDNGLEVGDRVALHQHRSIEYVVSVLAAIRVGATFVPIASDQAVARTAFMLRDSGVKLVLTQENLRSNITEDIPALNVDLEELQALSTQTEPVNRTNALHADSVAYILYTSGSTGNPKGVLISFEALSNYLHWALEYYQLEDEAFVFPFFTNIGFDLTLTSLFLPLLTGGELIIFEENISAGSDFSVLDVVRDNSVNIIKLTPSHIRLMLTESLDNSKLKTFVVGGEDFKSKTAAALQNAISHEIDIYNEYGPTEATIGCIVAHYDAEQHSTGSVPIGRPIRNTRALVLDSYGNAVPQGVPGELYIGGMGLALGYLNLPELTNEKFVAFDHEDSGKLYRSGDLVRVNAEGSYEFLGRMDDQVKHNGIRIELAEIESQMEALNEINKASVVLLKNELSEDSAIGDVLIGYYTGKEDLPKADIQARLSDNLPGYMQPDVFCYLDTFPLTQNGKIDKQALQSIGMSLEHSEAEFVAPRNEIEELIEGIWREVLQRDPIGVHENFVSLGGHSLAAIRVTARLNKELELDLKLSKIFEHPTIEQYSNYLEQTLRKLLNT